MNLCRGMILPMEMLSDISGLHPWDGTNISPTKDGKQKCPQTLSNATTTLLPSWQKCPLFANHWCRQVHNWTRCWKQVWNYPFGLNEGFMANMTSGALFGPSPVFVGPTSKNSFRICQWLCKYPCNIDFASQSAKPKVFTQRPFQRIFANPWIRPVVSTLPCIQHKIKFVNFF